MKGRALGLQKLEEMVNARRRDIGSGIWQIVRNRRDNLALGYVDSEHKSGATTTRLAEEFAAWKMYGCHRTRWMDAKPR